MHEHNKKVVPINSAGLGAEFNLEDVELGAYLTPKKSIKPGAIDTPSTDSNEGSSTSHSSSPLIPLSLSNEFYETENRPTNNEQGEKQDPIKRFSEGLERAAKTHEYFSWVVGYGPTIITLATLVLESYLFYQLFCESRPSTSSPCLVVESGESTRFPTSFPTSAPIPKEEWSDMLGVITAALPFFLNYCLRNIFQYFVFTSKRQFFLDYLSDRENNDAMGSFYESILLDEIRKLCEKRNLMGLFDIIEKEKIFFLQKNDIFSKEVEKLEKYKKLWMDRNTLYSYNYMPRILLAMFIMAALVLVGVMFMYTYSDVRLGKMSVLMVTSLIALLQVFIDALAFFSGNETLYVFKVTSDSLDADCSIITAVHKVLAASVTSLTEDAKDVAVSFGFQELEVYAKSASGCSFFSRLVHQTIDEEILSHYEDERQRYLKANATQVDLIQDSFLPAYIKKAVFCDFSTDLNALIEMLQEFKDMPPPKNEQRRDVQEVGLAIEAISESIKSLNETKSKYNGGKEVYGFRPKE